MRGCRFIADETGTPTLFSGQSSCLMFNLT